MATIAEMQVRLDSLLQLRSDGVRKAGFGDDQVEFRSDSELAAAIADLERRIAAETTPRSRMIYPKVSKGY